MQYMTNTYKQLIELAKGDFKGNIIKIFTGIKETIEPMKQKGSYLKKIK